MSRIRRAIRDGGELSAIAIGRLVFIAVLFIVAVIAATPTMPILALILSMFLVYVMVSTILPADTIRSYTESAWQGEPFVSAWRRLWGR